MWWLEVWVFIVEAERLIEGNGVKTL